MTRHARACLILSLLIAPYASSAQNPALETAAKPLKVLFLGDQGHHRPADRFAQLQPVLATRGIDVVYTENLADLNPTKLKEFDALAVYANIERITPDAETAILDYVENGGGFVPLHCGSYCFLNSPRYVALVGAQFARHGTGIVTTNIVTPEHAVMKGITPFTTWDETYVHTKHNVTDRTVLQARKEGESDEPWTWVRTQGKGRVFYTAYGHDARAWGNPGFHDLVERGIRWAANKGSVQDSRPRVAKGLKPFEFVEAELPNYLAGERWGTIGEPIKKMQQPVSAEESQKHLVLPRGFEASLFASEPSIHKPICMAFDHRGRLWLAETVDYPNERQRAGSGRDRIAICEDTDGDGSADRFTVFAENLSIPTSLCFARGGVIVTQAPEILFLKDNDGDDKADVREVLFRGFDTRDTHAGPSNLRYGFDGWIYGIIGYSGFDGLVAGERIAFRQGFFRFLPDGSKMEFLRSTSNNSWGVGFSEEGLLFGSTANGCPSVFMPIANRYYESVRGWSPTVLRNTADSNRFWPVTENVRQVDFHGGFTAGAGHALYTARLFPSPYWNRTAFITEPTGHLAATFTLHPKGADFESHYGWNLVASDDEWTAPIAAEVGPDGAVWVIDWYNIIVQHNPTPQGYQTGRGNAYETPIRDKTHGRIYRIKPTGKEVRSEPPLDPANAEQLLTALKSSNLLWRLHAQRLLVERGNRDVVPALVKLVGDPTVEPLGLNAGATHALWALHLLGALDGPNAVPEARPAALGALKHGAPGVRRNALLVAPRDEESARAVIAAGRLEDDDPQVRLAALLTLAECPADPSVALALVQTLFRQDGPPDPVLVDGLIAAAARNSGEFLASLSRSRLERAPRPAEIGVAARVAEHHARGKLPVDQILTSAAIGGPRLAGPVLAGLEKGWPEGATIPLSPEARAALVTLIGRLEGDSLAAFVGLARRWGAEGLDDAFAKVLTSLEAELDNDAAGEAGRIAAARRLIQLAAPGSDATATILRHITPRTPPGVASGWVEALGTSSSPTVADSMIEALPALLPDARSSALRTLLSRPAWTKSLLDAIESGSVRLDALALDQRQALATHRDRTIAERAKSLLAKGGGLPDANRQSVIEQLSDQLAKGGDPTKGKLAFETHCAKCHRHTGEGGDVGPDLSGMAAHPREELMVHLLDPSRSVEGTFVLYTVAMSDGRVLSGMLASESRTSIELIDTEGKKQTILRDDIDELVATSKSVMPEGFEKQMAVDDLRNLLAFLTQRGKYLPLDIAKVATAVSTKGMFYDENSPAERIVFPDWAPKTLDNIPFVLVDPKGDRVRNAVVLQSRSGPLTRNHPRNVELPCHTSAKAIHLLGGIGGWAYPYNSEKTVSLIVRLHYADGQVEDHSLRNGEHIADYNKVVDVPGSKLAMKLRNDYQIRSITITPKREAEIDHIELVKGQDATAPIVMAVTVETK